MARCVGASRYWYYQSPDGEIHGPIRFRLQHTERELRAWMRRQLNRRRLPSGYEFWPAEPGGKE